MKSIWILLMTLIALILLSIAVYFYLTEDIRIKLMGGEEKEIENITGDETGLDSESISTDGEGGSGEGSEADENSGEVTLPLDIEDKLCGFYFKDYGVCAGVCPKGKCISEGRSCYCKESV